MSIAKTVIQSLLALLVFSVVKIVLGILITFSPGFSAIPEQEAWFLFPSMLIHGICYGILILYVCRKSYLPSLKLAAVLTPVFITLNVLLVNVETLYFHEAFPSITDADILKLFVLGVLFGVAYVPSAVFIFRGKAVPEKDDTADFSLERTWWKYPIAALLYVALYLGFGFIAQLSPSLQQEYAEWIGGATDKVRMLPLFQIPRGVGFAASAVAIFLLFKKRRYAVTAAALLLSLLISIQLIGPNPLMSRSLRTVHFFEITLSMGIYGILSGVLLLRKKT